MFMHIDHIGRIDPVTFGQLLSYGEGESDPAMISDLHQQETRYQESRSKGLGIMGAFPAEL